MEFIIGLVIGGVIGFRAGMVIAGTPRDRDPDWRRSFNHENINRPSSPLPLRLDTGRQQRGNGIGSSELPKPKIVPTTQSSTH